MKKDKRKRGTIEEPLTLTPSEWKKLRAIKYHNPYRSITKTKARELRHFKVEVPENPTESDIRKAYGILASRKEQQKRMTRTTRRPE